MLAVNKPHRWHSHSPTIVSVRRAIFNECNAFGPNLLKRLNLDHIERLVMPDEPETGEDDLEDDGNLSDEDRGEVEVSRFQTPPEFAIAAQWPPITLVWFVG